MCRFVKDRSSGTNLSVPIPATNTYKENRTDIFSFAQEEKNKAGSNRTELANNVPSLPSSSWIHRRRPRAHFPAAEADRERKMGREGCCHTVIVVTTLYPCRHCTAPTKQLRSCPRRCRAISLLSLRRAKQTTFVLYPRRRRSVPRNLQLMHHAIETGRGGGEGCHR